MIATLFRTALLYIVVMICIRLMGKRQVGELQPGELVVTILISELASIPMQDLDSPIANGIIAILVLVALEILLSALSLKSSFLRRVFQGKPAIVIANGVVDQKMMKRLRISIDDLLEGLRQEGTFRIESIDFAIMETNGKLSVLQKQATLPVTRDDMHIPTRQTGLPVTVISDGKLQKDAFSTGLVTNELLRARLRAQKLTVEDVFLMTVDYDGNYMTIQKDKTL